MMRELTYKDMLVNDLQKMRDWQFAVQQIGEELAALEAEYTTIKATNYDKMPTGSGDNTQEEKLLTAIAKKDEKRQELKLTRRRLADLQRLLDQLPTEERQIIERAVINRERYESIAEDLHLEQRQVYNRRNAALAHLLRLRHGAAYHA